MTIVGIKELRQKMGAATRLIGLDHSPTRIGVALADLTTRIVTPLAVLRGKNFTENTKELRKLCDKHAITTLIVGLPLNMDGSEGPRAQSVRHFALNIERASALLGFSPLIGFVDERLSSFDADQRLESASRKARDQQDAVAAAIMLEDVLALMTAPPPA